jgi:hypothetical protein
MSSQIRPHLFFMGKPTSFAELHTMTQAVANSLIADKQRLEHAMTLYCSVSSTPQIMPESSRGQRPNARCWRCNRIGHLRSQCSMKVNTDSPSFKKFGNLAERSNMRRLECILVSKPRKFCRPGGYSGFLPYIKLNLTGAVIYALVDSGSSITMISSQHVLNRDKVADCHVICVSVRNEAFCLEEAVSLHIENFSWTQFLRHEGPSC